MEGCVSLLNDLLASIGCPETQIEQRVGSDGTARCKRSNYISLGNDVLKNLKSLASREGFAQLPIEIYDDELGDEDKLFLVWRIEHSIVVLYMPESNTSVIGDGANHYIESLDCKAELDGIFRTNNSGVEFLNQSGQDHCGLCGDDRARVFEIAQERKAMAENSLCSNPNQKQVEEKFL